MDRDLVLKVHFDRYREIKAQAMKRDPNVLDLELHVRAHEILRELFKALRFSDDRTVEVEIEDFMFLDQRN